MARQQLTPDGRRGVESYSPTQLHQMLVTDAVKRHATHLPWAVEAYKRIGERTGKGAEAAFQAVLDEVETLTGSRDMPVDRPTTVAELARLMEPTK